MAISQYMHVVVSATTLHQTDNESHKITGECIWNICKSRALLLLSRHMSMATGMVKSARSKPDHRSRVNLNRGI